MHYTNMEIFPVFGISKISNFIANNDCRYYIDVEHQKIISDEINRQMDETVLLTNILSVEVVNDNEMYHLIPHRLSTIILCISSVGGCVISIDNDVNDKNILTFPINHAVIISPLSKCVVVSKGPTTILVVKADIPSKRLVTSFTNDILYVNNLSLINYLPSSVFIIRRVTDYLDRHICDQIFANNKWYSIITIDDKQYPIPSNCIGMSSAKYINSSIEQDILIHVCNLEHPFDSVYKKMQSYNSLPIKEQILYGRIDNINMSISISVD
ncbi:CPXV173 protein [Monkeypox virus]|nr:CPXV173 protein [Monkeypox virus]WDP17957.1 CPXV173 protein [Monkeypox virus]